MRNLRSNLGLAALALLVCATEVWAQAAATEKAPPQTVITSKRFEYAASKGEAVFEDNVVVTDPRLSMKADKLWVYFDDAQQVRMIKATGEQVLLQQADRTAGCKNVIYDVKQGKMVLTDNAWVRQGQNLLKGNLITLWRDEERITSQDNVSFRLTLGSAVAPSLDRSRGP